MTLGYVAGDAGRGTHRSGPLKEPWCIKNGLVGEKNGHSLAVQWLGLGAFTARALVGELRSHKLRGAAKKKKKGLVGWCGLHLAGRHPRWGPHEWGLQDVPLPWEPCACRPFGENHIYMDPLVGTNQYGSIAS